MTFASPSGTSFRWVVAAELQYVIIIININIAIFMTIISYDIASPSKDADLSHCSPPLSNGSVLHPVQESALSSLLLLVFCLLWHVHNYWVATSLVWPYTWFQFDTCYDLYKAISYSWTFIIMIYAPCLSMLYQCFPSYYPLSAFLDFLSKSFVRQISEPHVRNGRLLFLILLSLPKALNCIPILFLVSRYYKH